MEIIEGEEYLEDVVSMCEPSSLYHYYLSYRPLTPMHRFFSTAEHVQTP